MKFSPAQTFSRGRMVLAGADFRFQELSAITRLQTRFLNSVLERFDTRTVENLRCLDVGCGTSPFRSMVEQRRIDYFGVDNRLLQREAEDRSFVVGRIEQIPLAEASFDLIVCTEVMEHVYSTKFFLDELHRVSKPRALLCLTVPFAQPLHEQPADYWRFTKYAIAQILEECGWKVEMIRPRGSILSLMQHVALCFTLGCLTKLRVRPVRALKMADFTVGRTSRWRIFARPSDTFPHGYFVTALRDE